MKGRILMCVLLFTLLGKTVFSQEKKWGNEVKLGVVLGLTQPIFVDGFNLEGVFVYKKFIFDYSHGVSLDFIGESLPKALKDQSLKVHMPFTTGFGFGYRFTKWLNIRIEPKWHQFEFYYNGEAIADGNKILEKNTISLGVGLYGFFQPFKSKNKILQGLTFAPSLRYWPTIKSDLNENGFSYQNKVNGKEEVINTLDPGIGFTPLIFNLSIGYMFSFK